MEDVKISKKKFTFLFIIIILIILSLITVNATGNMTNKNDNTTSSFKTNVNEINHEKIQQTHEIKDDKKLKTTKKDNTKESLEITANNIDTYVDDEITVIYDTNKPIDDGIMTYYIDNNRIGIQNLSDEKDYFTYNITEYKVGVHNLRIDYAGSEKYTNTYTTLTLTISKYSTQIEDLKIEFNQENNIDILFKLRSQNNYINTGSIILYNETTPILTQKICEPDIKITLQPYYNYQILTLYYPGSRNSEELNISQLIYAQKQNISIFMPSIRGYHKDIINSTITLTSKRNITDGFINIYIEDMIYKTINITSKTINTNFNLTEYLEGQYNIQLQYAGSNIFADATYNTTLTVNKINTRIYANNITCYKNSQVNLSVSVTNYVDKTDEGILEFILDNESIKTVLVNDTTTVLNYYIPENYEYGDYELLVLYHGSDRYNSSNLTLNLSINKYPLNMYIRNTTFDDENITLNLQLSCYMNKTIADGRVDVYLDNIYVTSANITSNLVVIHLPGYVKTNHIYNITLDYYNSSFFSNVSRSQQINISKINTTIKISQYTTNKNILNITTTIYAKDYSNITCGTLEIKIDDKTIYIKDIKTNINQVLYNLTNTKITNHTITAIYNGTNKYQNTTNTTTFEYIPRQTTIYIKTNNTIHTSPLNTITINATLQDYEANPIKTTIPTIIQIKNQTIKTQFTNATLKQTYKIDDIPDQNITITITTQQTPYYKSTTRNITLTIQRNTTNINTNTNIHATKNENIIINATLTSNQKQINTTIPLTIQIENQTIKTQFTNGKLNITIPLKGMNKDKYQITLQTQPTTHYKQATKTIHLTLNKRATYIKSQNIQTICGDIAIINATVYDLKTHKPITQKTPYVIKINQVTQTKNTTQNANILYKYTNKKPNQYNITIISGETSLYMKSTWNGTLNLTTKKLKIQSKNINTLTNQKIQINAKILDENKQINTTITVILKINKKIDTITIKNGIIKYTYQLSEKYSAKKHNITIVTKPTPKYARSETTIQLIINKQYPQIKTTNITAKKSTTIHIKANIQVNNKNINHKIKVNIKLSQKSICTINVTDGKIDYKYKIPNLRPGLYEILIQSSETQIYHHITTYIVLKIV